MSNNNNNLPPQSTEHYVKLDDHDQSNGLMYSSIDTTMSGSVYNQQQPQQPMYQQQQLPPVVVGSSPSQQQPLVESTIMTNDNNNNTNNQAPPSRGIIETVNDSLRSLVNSMSISSTPTTNSTTRNNTYLQPKYNPIGNIENPQTLYEYTIDSGFLDCQLVHPTALGQVSSRITFEMIIQHKTIPNISQKINKNEIGGSATYRPDLKVHITALDKVSTFTERIEALVNSDPQKSLHNFFIYVIVKKTKVNLLDVQKTAIAYSPCFTLADFLKTGTEQQQQPMYSFDLFKDQQLREHVGKLGVRLSITAYSDYQYVNSLPSGFFASKAFTVPYTSKSQKISSLLSLTEKVKLWLNSYSSLIKVIEISNANDGKELVQVVLYQKL